MTTMAQSKVPYSKVLRVAKSQIGITEEPPNSNRQKFGAWYGWNGVYWCDQFLSWVCDDAGDIGLHGGKSASVWITAERFRAAGRYGTRPRVGAFAIFNGYSHIELVTGVGVGTISTIGGNTSGGRGSISNGGMVAANLRNAGLLVMGYCYPHYAAPVVTAPATPYPYELHRGARNRYVKLVQARLNQRMRPSPRLIVDGDYGPATERAVIAWQKQHKALDVDGVVGRHTWRSIFA